MARLPIDGISVAEPPASPIVEATLQLVQQKVRDRFGEHLANAGRDFGDFAFAGLGCNMSQADFAMVEAELLASGYRFDWSAAISVAERPEAYKGGGESGEIVFEHADAVVEPAVDGRARCGQGDNVVRHRSNVVGTARYIRSNERVMQYLTEGVPPDTVAIIDDSGGTLTAPIIEQFSGILCAGGSVRSHLGILSREYNIPCFMNAKLNGIRDGDTVEMEATADPKTTEDYQLGNDRVGRVWKRESQS